MRYLYAALFTFLLLGAAPAQTPKEKAKDKAGETKSSRKKLELESSRNNPTIVHAFREVVRKPSESTVRVLADGKEVSLGTIVGADGWIVTKWSEIREHQKLICKFKDGRELEAKLVGVKDDTDAAYDLAMLKVDTLGLTPVEWAPSSDATVGRWVATPGLEEDPVAIGVISVATRKYVPGDQPSRLPASKSGFLGVNLEDAPGGVKVTGFAAQQGKKKEPASPAAKAGVKKDDIIYEAAGKKVGDTEALINVISRLKPGDTVLLKIKRGDSDLDINVKLGQRPFEGNQQETMGSTLSNRRGGFPFILQHDTVLKPHDCGGPLVDLDGKTVGINIARAGRTESYAIPSEKVIVLLEDLKSGNLLPKMEPVKTSSALEVPETGLRISGKLDAGGDKDKARDGFKPNRLVKAHLVKLRAGVEYTIEMESTEFDSYLILEDEAGKMLAKDDDSGGGSNAKIVFTPKTNGVYRILATSYDPEEKGNFTLKVQRREATKEKN